MSAPDPGEVRATRSVLGVTQGGAVPAPSGVPAELGGRFPERPGTRTGPEPPQERAVSPRQYAQRGSVIESYLTRIRPRGKFPRARSALPTCGAPAILHRGAGPASGTRGAGDTR